MSATLPSILTTGSVRHQVRPALASPARRTSGIAASAPPPSSFVSERRLSRFVDSILMHLASLTGDSLDPERAALEPVVRVGLLGPEQRAVGRADGIHLDRQGAVVGADPDRNLDLERSTALRETARRLQI